MKQFIISLSFLFLSINIATGQWTLVESLDAVEVAAAYGIPAQYDVDSYRVEYPTTNIDGTEGMASGLLSVPRNSDFKFPMLIFQHGTVNSRTDVPSNLAGGYQFGPIFAALGYTVLMPDYLGLGINPGVHPYVHADSEAWVSIDMMKEVESKISENIPGRYLNDQIFISGYSQGGHAGMALHRALELDFADDYTVTAASHMSGPYSISEKMIDFTMGDDEYGFSGYLASTSLSAKAAFPDLLIDFEIEDVFKAQYVDFVYAFANEEIDLGTLNGHLEDGLLADVGKITPKDLLLPEIVDALKNDPSHPLSQALQMNDVYDWAPQAPTRLLYCTADDQVTFENAILAEEVMNANGAFDLIAQEQGATLDHGGCVTPATTTTVFFFLSYRDLVASTGDILDSPLSQMSFAQFETNLQVMVDPAIFNMDNPTFVIMDMNGRQLMTHDIKRDQFVMDLAGITSGMYVASIIANGKIQESKKLFVK